jgi:hypothetical protein
MIPLIQEKLNLSPRFRFKALYATIYRAKQYFTKEELLPLVHEAERARLFHRYEIICGGGKRVERRALAEYLRVRTFERFLTNSSLAKAVKRIYERN